MTTEVEYAGIIFEVKGTLVKPPYFTWHHSEPPAELDDVIISIQGIDVYEILSNKQIDAIVDLALDIIG